MYPITNGAQHRGKYHIGLVESADGWMWQDGTPFNYLILNWATGQPDNTEETRGLLQVWDMQVNDISPTYEAAFICEKTPLKP